MSPNTKRLLSLAALGIGTLLTLNGFGIITGSFGNHALIVKGLRFMVPGLLIALPAAVFEVYYRQNQKWLPPQDKVDVETMAKLAQSKKPPAKTP